MLADKRRTYFVNIKGNREGISEDTTKLLDYFKTGQPTDSYTENIQNEVELIRDDNDKCIKFSMKTRYAASAHLPKANLHGLMFQVEGELYDDRNENGSEI